MRGTTIVAVSGIANQGKSSSIKLAYSLLRKEFPNAQIEEIQIGVDITVVITINGVKVGIESQGDPNSRLFDSLEHFVKIGCKIIVCATRTRGGTVEAVEALSNKFRIEWLSPNPTTSKSKEDHANGVVAQQIVNIVLFALRA